MTMNELAQAIQQCSNGRRARTLAGSTAALRIVQRSQWKLTDALANHEYLRDGSY